MTSNARRPGFRLWGSDSADEPEEQAAMQAMVDAAEPTPSSDAPNSDAPSSDAPSVNASSADPMPAPAPEAAGFLASLVGAMRGVAEEARDGNLGEFRSSVEQRISAAEVDAAARSEDLRRQADLDVEAITSWERSEIERIRAESEAKATARREELDRQLAEHRSTTESRVSAMREKLAEHERALTEFFRELSAIQDPTLFVTMAKRMPRPPLLGAEATDAPAPATDAPAPATDAPAPRQTLEARLAELGVERTTPGETAAPMQTPQPPTPVEAAGATADDVAQAEPPPAETASATEPDSAPAAAAVATDDARDRQLSDRLAQLDSQLAASPASEAPSGNGVADVAPTTDETSTAIVVKGLGSFGAITSFKQALERVDGIDGVTLSLGPTGEFVYRASHASDFDVIAAVRAVEGSGAEIERADGAVRVTVSRNR